MSGRNSSNRRRAVSFPYLLPIEAANAATDELVYKFEQRRDSAGLCRCYLCGRQLSRDADWHLEHLHPLGLGGLHVVSNLEMACGQCNLSKGALTLVDFLGPDLERQWRKDGWPPPFTLLRENPTDELYKRDPRVAKRLARTPRTMPPVDGRWSSPGALDELIALILMGERDRYRALSLSDLAQRAGVPGGGPLNQAWDVAMGIYTSPSNPGYIDHMYVQSPWVVATRVPDGSIVGARAFRLRFDVQLPPRRMPDYDEM